MSQLYIKRNQCPIPEGPFLQTILYLPFEDIKKLYHTSSERSCFTKYVVNEIAKAYGSEEIINNFVDLTLFYKKKFDANNLLYESLLTGNFESSDIAIINGADNVIELLSYSMWNVKTAIYLYNNRLYDRLYRDTRKNMRIMVLRNIIMNGGTVKDLEDFLERDGMSISGSTRDIIYGIASESSNVSIKAYLIDYAKRLYGIDYKF